MLLQMLTLGALLYSAATVASAQQPTVKIKEDTPGLLAHARITPDSAIKLARARIPSGTIRSGEIESEDGRLIYSFDIKTAGRSGIDEVNVDARTGKVLPVEHEGPKAEAAERAADSAKVKAKP
jgi:uncharacterized membrane protein YkoI